MADKTPNYGVERMRLEIQLDEHDDTIERGHSRLAEIDRAKARNIARAALQNAELDSEAALVRENEAALEGRKAEINTNLAAMKKG